jgi:hypothetical protein
MIIRRIQRTDHQNQSAAAAISSTTSRIITNFCTQASIGINNFFGSQLVEFQVEAAVVSVPLFHVETGHHHHRLPLGGIQAPIVFLRWNLEARVWYGIKNESDSVPATAPSKSEKIYFTRAPTILLRQGKNSKRQQQKVN